MDPYNLLPISSSQLLKEQTVVIEMYQNMRRDLLLHLIIVDNTANPPLTW